MHQTRNALDKTGEQENTSCEPRSRLRRDGSY
jgi:hypothetical protein